MYTKIKQVINSKLSDNNEHVINQDLELTGNSGNKVIQNMESTDPIETMIKL